jgi:hypothetical protein
VAHVLSTPLTVSSKDDETGPAFLVKKICAESDLASEVSKQVTDVQMLVNADVAAIIKLVVV